MNTSESAFAKRHARRGLALAAAFAALPAAAEPMLQIDLFRNPDMSRWSENYIELGAGISDRRSFKFGEWSGLYRGTGFAIGGFHWLSRDKANDAQYWRAFGSNLGLDSRKLLFEGGRQGGWNVSFGLDQLTRYETESTRFIHQGLGSSSLTLPAGFAGISAGASQPANVGNAAVINNALNLFEIKQGRDIYRLAWNGLLSSQWDFKVNYREDRRDGTRLTGAAFAVTAGNPRSVIVPYQIDDRTQQVEAVLGYTAKWAQLQLSYTYSRYENDLSAFRWQSPFAPVTSGGSPWVAGQVPLGTTGQLSLMPSNDYHQLNAVGAYVVSPKTRLTGQFSYGIARQDQAFLPYTSNPSFTASGATSTASLPRTSLNGEVVNTLLDLALVTKPLDKMNLRVGYQFRESDNRSPQDQYRYVRLDTCDPRGGGSCTDDRERRTNVPVSSKENKLVADADYEILPRTRLRGVWEHRRVNYTNADRSHVTDNKLSLEVRRPISTEFTGALRIARTERRGSAYDKNQFFVKSYSATYANATRFDNNPQMRQFLYADYDENRLRASGNWTASETVSVQGAFDWFRQRNRGPNCGTMVDSQVLAAGLAWPDECIGRTQVDGTTASLDGQWQPEENLTAFGFYTYSEYGVDQHERSWNNLTTQPPNSTARNYRTQHNYSDHTLGLGMKWQAREGLDVGGQYAYNYGIGRIAVATGSALTSVGTVPDLRSKMHTLQVFAKWKYSKQLTWRLNYWYEQLATADWAYDNATPTSSNNVLLTGQNAPRYRNHVIGVSAAIHSW